MQTHEPSDTVWLSCGSVLFIAGDEEYAPDGSGGAAQAENRDQDCHKDEEVGRFKKELHTFRMKCKPFINHGNHDDSVCTCCY